MKGIHVAEANVLYIKITKSTHLVVLQVNSTVYVYTVYSGLFLSQLCR